MQANPFILDLNAYVFKQPIEYTSPSNIQLKLFAHRSNNQNVMFKFFPVQTEAFQREVFILTRLNHPAVINFLGYHLPQQGIHQTQFQPIIATEYMLHNTLSKVLLDPKLKNSHLWSDTKRFCAIYGISAAMAHLHSINCTHFELTANNILVDDNFEVRLTGFGKFNYSSEKVRKPNIATRPPHMAPEIHLDNPPQNHVHGSTKVDVYAFGVLLYQIFTSRLPMTEFENSLHQYDDRVLRKGERASLNSSLIPLPYRKLITQCWAQHPHERPSFTDILHKLEKKSYQWEGVDPKQANHYIVRCRTSAQLLSSEDVFRLKLGVQDPFAKALHGRNRLRNCDLDGALQYFAESTHPLSSCMLGVIYEWGLVPGTKQDVLYYYSKAEAEGSVEAKARYALHVSSTKDELERCLKECAYALDPFGQYAYGLFLLENHQIDEAMTFLKLSHCPEAIHKLGQLSNDEHLVLDAAQQGYPPALFEMGRRTQNSDWFQHGARLKSPDCLYEMFLVEKKSLNYHQAFQYLKDAADRNWDHALLKIGELYLEGGIMTNVKRVEAVSVLMKCKLGPAQTILGKLFRTGADGIEQNDALAFMHFEQAASMDDPEAKNYLGRMYEQGISCDQSIEKAIELFRESEQRGNAKGAHNLARMYMLGYLPMDRDRVKELLTHAIDGGIDIAMYNLACLYLNGTLRRDPTQANRLLHRAAKANIPHAYVKLGQMYEEGNGIEKNVDTATEMYHKAIELGDYSAYLNLAEMKKKTRDLFGAIELWDKALEKNVFQAAGLIGKTYEIVGQTQKAIEYYQTGARHDDAFSVKRLAQLCPELANPL